MTHNIVQLYQTAAGALQATTQITADTEINADVILAASATNVELDVALIRSKVKSLALFCSGDCTAKSNSTSAPDDTVTLTAGQLTVCKSSTEVSALLSHADITKFYLSSTAGGTFSLRAIVDNTPGQNNP